MSWNSAAAALSDSCVLRMLTYETNKPKLHGARAAELLRCSDRNRSRSERVLYSYAFDKKKFIESSLWFYSDVWYVVSDAGLKLKTNADRLTTKCRSSRSRNNLSHISETPRCTVVHLDHNTIYDHHSVFDFSHAYGKHFCKAKMLKLLRKCRQLFSATVSLTSVHSDFLWTSALNSR